MITADSSDGLLKRLINLLKPQTNQVPSDFSAIPSEDTKPWYLAEVLNHDIAGSSCGRVAIKG